MEEWWGVITCFPVTVQPQNVQRTYDLAKKKKKEKKSDAKSGSEHVARLLHTNIGSAGRVRVDVWWRNRGRGQFAQRSRGGTESRLSETSGVGRKVALPRRSLTERRTHAAVAPPSRCNGVEQPRSAVHNVHIYVRLMLPLPRDHVHSRLAKTRKT